MKINIKKFSQHAPSIQLSEAPSAQRGKVGAETIAKKNKAAEEEIEKMLAQLKS